MKWRVKSEILPKDGDERKRLVFAWKKTKVEGYWVWLETYWQHETFYVAASSNAWWSDAGKTLAFPG